MIDQRVQKMANLLVNYSLELKKGDRFMIKGSDATLPLIKEVYREAIKVGAHPEININIAALQEILYKEGSDQQIEYISPIEELTMKQYDAFLMIGGDHNTRPFAGIDSSRIVKSRMARKDLRLTFSKRAASGDLNWCITHYPTHSGAQEANMSLDDYTDFVFNAARLNGENPVETWKEITQKQQKACNYLETKKELHITATDTDLKLTVAGRTWINANGKRNFPDGEVFTSPIKNSVNGHIRFSFPSIYEGQEVEDVTLTFKDGVVVDAKASKGEKLLIDILNTDEGARRVGEIAVGTNYGIKQFTKRILFDEKIGGTVHLAVGRGFLESGCGDIELNKSAIHWDLICDMAHGGEIHADGELIYQNGLFVTDLF